MTVLQQHSRRSTFGGAPSIVVALVAPIPAISGGWRFTLKGASDRVFALLALLFLAPLLLAITFGVRLSSVGPVILRQRRVGRGGETFVLFKFRTMIEDSGAARFTLADGTAPGGIEGADRRTAVGRWLRAISLDELPQLLNVLRGEMSLIGPRPERPEFVELFATKVPGYTERHRVKSGITGWAQANGLRGQTSIVDRVKLDNYYIENWSLGLDFRILALTVVELLRFRDGRPNPLQDRSAQHTATPSGCAGARGQLACAGRGRRLARAARNNHLALRRLHSHGGPSRRNSEAVMVALFLQPPLRVRPVYDADSASDQILRLPASCVRSCAPGQRDRLDRVKRDARVGRDATARAGLALAAGFRWPSGRVTRRCRL